MLLTPRAVSKSARGSDTIPEFVFLSGPFFVCVSSQARSMREPALSALI